MQRGCPLTIGADSRCVPGDEEASAPTRRGALAATRASQLRRRLIELAGGCAPTPAAAVFAQQCAQQAVGRAAVAHQSALSRHDETRRVHLRAAAAHEQAAIVSHCLDSDRHQEAAERHRDAAAQHAAIIASLSGRVVPLIRPSATRH
ncbi:hypothetical protein [Mycolicibacterium sediminis]|uniref:Uncharacterized protein n=1 Tax=Mycolicibacterium sediminis TaxID=1286180 RepID=A0A7I7QPV6_9MYCO|nr:hypothetical protein [Mycolicibacterium sediminis]BBY27997.1 hypothetical protein MSEDJ_20930 [Mycolicibacterium sediminis]